jgi:hypothetical protein
MHFRCARSCIELIAQLETVSLEKLRNPLIHRCIAESRCSYAASIIARQRPRCADCGVGVQIANPLRCLTAQMNHGHNIVDCSDPGYRRADPWLTGHRATSRRCARPHQGQCRVFASVFESEWSSSTTCKARGGHGRFSAIALSKAMQAAACPDRGGLPVHLPSSTSTKRRH